MKSKIMLQCMIKNKKNINHEIDIKNNLFLSMIWKLERKRQLVLSVNWSTSNPQKNAKAFYVNFQ